MAARRTGLVLVQGRVAAGGATRMALVAGSRAMARSVEMLGADRASRAWRRETCPCR
jgi:hypothetical protein